MGFTIQRTWLDSGHSSKQASMISYLLQSLVLLFRSVPQFAPPSGHSGTWQYLPQSSAFKAETPVGIRSILAQFMGLEVHKHFYEVTSSNLFLHVISIIEARKLEICLFNLPRASYYVPMSGPRGGGQREKISSRALFTLLRPQFFLFERRTLPPEF